MRPRPTDAHEYYFRYIDLVPSDDVATALAVQMHETQALLRALPEAKGEHRYAPDKWSIKELVAHLADSERVFAFRMLWFARGAPAPLPSFEQDDWVRDNDFGRRSLASLTEELRLVRESTLQLLHTLTPRQLERAGVASERPFVARVVPWIVAGHELHHRQVLRERYL